MREIGPAGDAGNGPRDNGQSERQLGYQDPRSRGAADDGVNLLGILSVLWAGKWIVLAVSLAFGSVGVAYALYAEPWYRAEVVLIRADQNSSLGLSGQLAQLGGLAGIAGIRLNGADDSEPIAVLQSREFAGRFIKQNQLLTVLLADQWDAETESWKARGKDTPDIRDAVKYFDENIRRVVDDRKTGLVKLTIDWKDPDMAARWANLMVEQLNRDLRDRAFASAEDNIKYLQAQMGATSVVSLQAAIGRLLETEMQKLMLARGNKEFAFRVVDRAEVPKRHVRPRRSVIVLATTLLGGVLAAAFLLFRESSGTRGAVD